MKGFFSDKFSKTRTNVFSLGVPSRACLLDDLEEPQIVLNEVRVFAIVCCIFDVFRFSFCYCRRVYGCLQCSMICYCVCMHVCMSPYTDVVHASVGVDMYVTYYVCMLTHIT